LNGVTDKQSSSAKLAAGIVLDWRAKMKVNGLILSQQDVTYIA